MFSARYGLWQITKFSKRAQSDKDLRDKPFKIADDPKYDGYQTGLASMVYKFSLVEVVLLMNQIISWQINFINQLFENSKKRKAY